MPLENVLLVPYVLKGRVVGMEDAPATFGQFKVVYTVAVENTIAGDKLPSKIEVYSRSSSGNNFFFNFNNEPVLQLGEEVVLYLNQMQFTPYQPRQRKPGEPQFEDISITPSQNPEPKQIFTAALKFTVKNNQLFDAANRPFTTVAEFSKMAGKIYKINQQKKFFKRSYC